MTLRELVRWARHEYQLEAPPLAIHEGYDHIGDGGAPKYTAAFMRYLQAPPWAVDPLDETYYVAPLRATMARMSRRHPLMASICLVLAQGEYSADAVVAMVCPTVPAELRATVAYGALEKLHRMYRERTPVPVRQTSWVDLSESQQQAILHATAGTATLYPAE